MSFQAETKQLLNIVTNALYTDRHVFVRELVSNASDALEKVRHMQVSNEEIQDPTRPLEIRIETNEGEGTFTISDSGVGLTREELTQNLGTIAHSGSKSFMTEMQKKVRRTSSRIVGNISGEVASENSDGVLFLDVAGSIPKRSGA